LKNIVFIALLFLTSCIDKSTLNNSFPSQLLHGNSAKVWIIKESSDSNDKNISALNNYLKSFIFYSNQRFRDQELIHLGSKEGQKGIYSIKKDKYEKIILHLSYSEGDRRNFVIQEISNTKLTLQSLNGSRATWELSSLKPPKL